VGDIPIDVPTNQNIGMDTSVPGIPGGVDAYARQERKMNSFQDKLEQPYWWREKYFHDSPKNQVVVGSLQTRYELGL